MRRALLSVLLLCGVAMGAAEDLPAQVAALAAAHPGLARVEHLATSLRGRPVQGLVLAAGEVPLAERQGLLLVAGLDGRRLADSDLLVDVAASLLSRADLAERLAGRALVFVPRANPDGAATLLGELGAVLETAGNRRPDDADRDGRRDEDGPADLDGDGLVTWMAAPDGAGEWVRDSHDARAFRKRKPDERGTHRLLREGRDADGDGELAEDGLEGVLLDRNFPHGFRDAHLPSGAHPLSEPEALALALFLLDHPGLHSVLVVGEDDTLVAAPKKAGKVSRGGFGGGFREPLDGLLEEDLPVLEQWGTWLKDAAGEGQHEVKGEPLADGSLLAWAYHQAGRWPLGLRAWRVTETIPEPPKSAEAQADAAAGSAAVAATPDEPAARAEDSEEGKAAEEKTKDKSDEGKPGSDSTSPVPAAVLAWLDRDHGGAGILAWQPFEHPDLGPVEIGGLRPGVLLNAPVADLAAVTATLAEFALTALDASPALALEDLEVTDHGGGLLGVEVALVNTGRLPTVPRFAADARLLRPLRVTLELPEGAARVAGPAQVLVPHLAGRGGRHELRWTVAGLAPGAALTVRVDADGLPDIHLEVPRP